MHVQIILPCTYNLLCQQKCSRSSCQARQDKQSSTCVQQLPAAIYALFREGMHKKGIDMGLFSTQA